MGAVPGALAGAGGDDGDDRAVAAPARLPDVQLERRGDLQLAARDVEDVERAPPLARRPRWNRRGASNRAARPSRRACPSRARRSARRRDRPRAAGCASRRATTRGARRCRAPRRAGAPRRGRRARARTAARCPRRGGRRGSSASCRRATSAGPSRSFGPCVICRMPGAVRGGQADAAAAAAPRARRAGSRQIAICVPSGLARRSPARVTWPNPGAASRRYSSSIFWYSGVSRRSRCIRRRIRLARIGERATASGLCKAREALERR